MSDQDLAEKLVSVLQRPDGNTNLRPVHSIGISATGFFEPSLIARNFCTADHFCNERSDVIVRFSNGSGAASVH
ncbi:MAG: hypothetical protein AAFY14_13525, partial [Pseudomonadota bacterium]